MTPFFSLILEARARAMRSIGAVTTSRDTSVIPSGDARVVGDDARLAGRGTRDAVTTRADAVREVARDMSRARDGANVGVTRATRATSRGDVSRPLSQTLYPPPSCPKGGYIRPNTTSVCSPRGSENEKMTSHKNTSRVQMDGRRVYIGPNTTSVCSPRGSENEKMTSHKNTSRVQMDGRRVYIRPNTTSM